MKRGFFGRAFFLTVADAGQKGATALVALVLARFLGPADFGVYAAATAVTGLFITFSEVGFEQEMVRRSVRAPLGESFRLSVSWIAVMVALAASALVLQQRFFPNRLVPTGLLLMAGAFHVANRMQLPYRFAGVVLGETHVGAVIQSCASAFLIAATILVLRVHKSVAAVLMAQFLVALLTVGAWETWRRRRGGLSHGPVPRATSTAFFRRSLSFAMTNVLWALYFNIDVALMSVLRGAADVGVYSAAYRLIAMTFVVGSAVASTYSPALFAAAHEGPGRHRALAAKMMRTLTGVGTVTALALAVGAGIAIPLVMGKDYAVVIPAARVLAAAAFFRVVNFGFSELLTTGGRHAWRVGLEAGLLVANIAFNLAWIPRFGPMGAAGAAVASEILMTAAGVVLWRQLIRVRPAVAIAPTARTNAPAEAAAAR